MVISKNFQNTEVGSIPTDWEIKKLETLFNITSSKRVFQNEWRSSGIPFYRARELAVLSETGQVDNELFISRDMYEKYASQYGAIKQDDILITGVGTLGKVYVVKSGDVFYFKDGNIIWLQTKNKVDSYFVRQLYFTPALIAQVFGSSAGTTVGTYTISNAKATLIPLPPPPEQRAIATALSDTDSLIAALEKLITKKRATKQGAMQELLTGKRRLPGFSGEWINFNLAANSTLKARIGWQGLTTAEYLTEGYAYLITGTDFAYGKIVWSGCHFVEKVRYDQDINIQVSNGDVLITKDGTIGKVAIVNGLTQKATLNSGVFVVRPKNNAYSSVYIYYVLSSKIFTDFLAKLAAGSTINHLYQKDFINFEFFIPPTEREQTEIASILSDMDAELDTLEAKLEKLKNIKKGMMSELLTGRIRLVKQKADAAPMAKTTDLSEQKSKGHNQQFDDAVMIAGIVNALYSDKYPLGRKRVQKCLYLLRRYQDEGTTAFKKKAAGPYADEVRYKGGEPIARSAHYITVTAVKGRQGTTFARGSDIDKALGYIENWGKQGDINWVADKLKFKKTDELELLATVDMAICDLEEAGMSISVASIKQLIASNEEWKAKLHKQTFSDAHIASAIRALQALLRKGS